jgi:methyl halide transferase
MLTLEEQGYWESRYTSQTTGWDVGTITTPLKTYIDQVADRSQKVLVPGCGNAHEINYLLEKGFSNVTAIDIAPSACKHILQLQEQHIGESLTVICGDFFTLQGQYDLIIEQTFFCALPVKLRSNYVQKMHDLLSPNGRLVGLLFNRSFDKAGPPFGGTAEEYEKLFSKHFVFHTFEKSYNSVVARDRIGTEIFINLRPK